MSARRVSLDLEDLGLDEGGHVPLLRSLREVGPGGEVEVRGLAPDLALQLAVFAREGGHRFREAPPRERAQGVAGVVEAGEALVARLRGAQRAGSSRDEGDAVRAHADPRWGLAARGALVEAGAPAWDFTFTERDAVWTDEARRLYAQALTAQWEPSVLPWDAALPEDPALEEAVLQVMTYLAENEQAALLVPARFLGRIHPYFREVLQLLALQVSEEARHLEVFTRRALLRSAEPGLSTAGGQRSLQTLFEEDSFLTSTVLLAVLGEGTFVDLLSFVRDHAPDALTRAIAERTGRDEARHVAAGMAHAGYTLSREPEQRGVVKLCIERRHAALQHTSGLNAEVFDSLLVLAAGGTAPARLRRGFAAVQGLLTRMHEGRARRLERLGFDAADASALAGLHTRNFM